MRKYPIIAVILCLAACATPFSMLKNPKTGQVVECGGNRTGSLAGGIIGYELQKSDDEKCVSDYKAQGFQPI